MIVLKELILASVYIIQIQFAAAVWREFELIGFENSDTGFARTNLRLSRKSKSTFLLEGPFEFTEDLNDKFDCEVKLYSSPKGNNQYVLMPYKVARGLCCKLMESIYWTSIQSDAEKVSDIPKRNANERLCFSYKQGKYTIKGFEFDKKIIPKYIDPGTFKAELLVYKKETDEVSTKIVCTARLY